MYEDCGSDQQRVMCRVSSPACVKPAMRVQSLGSHASDISLGSADTPAPEYLQPCHDCSESINLEPQPRTTEASSAALRARIRHIFAPLHLASRPFRPAPLSSLHGDADHTPAAMATPPPSSNPSEPPADDYIIGTNTLPSNPTPLSAPQEQQVRDLYYRNVRAKCAEEIESASPHAAGAEPASTAC